MKFAKLLLLLIAFVLPACSERWEGFVYPNKSDLSKHIGIGTYQSLDECRASAVDVLSKVSSIQGGDFECGLNCRSDGALPGMKVCEETSK
jgi:hypothetical protein